MAKNSAVIKNERRKKLIDKYAKKRAELKAIVMNKELPLNERMDAQFKLANCRAIRLKTAIVTAAK